MCIINTFYFKVLEYARQYFNCPTLEYVPLEDEGKKGSKGSVLDDFQTYFDSFVIII